MLHVCIVGATGYTGAECVHLLRRHPSVARLTLPASSEGLGGVPADADAVLLATPAEAAAELAGPLVARGQRVVDLSGGHRLGRPDDHRAGYGFEHPHPAALADAVYGFAPSDTEVRAARLVANPGCYANAILSALVPLQRAGLLADGAVADVVGISGVSGAGRKATERTMYMNVAENLAPYRTGRSHQHVPEIERHAGVRLLFVPMVAPLRRGMLVSGTVEGSPADTPPHLHGDPLWRAVTEAPDVHAVAGTGLALVHLQWDGPSRRWQFVVAIDNLLRGAASHAVWNLNRMLGLPEHAGLEAWAPAAETAPALA